MPNVLRGVAVVLLFVGGAASAQQGLDRAWAKAAPSVVTVRSEQQGASLLGAGVVLHADGFIATAAHLVSLGETVSVQFHDGTLAAARLVTLSRSDDSALLKVDKLPQGVVAATLADSTKVAVGQPVFTVTPSSRALSSGVVRQVKSNDPKAPLGPKEVLLVSDVLLEGGEGAALFDASGAVVGLLNNLGGRGFATPSNQLRKRLFENVLPYVGMSLRYVTPELARMLNWPVEGGLLVEWVKPGSAAENGGIKGGTVDATVGGSALRFGGDVIVKVGDLDATRLDEIGQLLASRKAGSVLHYTVLRAGKQVPVQVQVLVEEVIKVPALKKK